MSVVFSHSTDNRSVLVLQCTLDCARLHGKTLVADVD